MIEKFQYEFHPKESVVFREKDLSNDKFYIIVEGKVAIL